MLHLLTPSPAYFPERLRELLGGEAVRILEIASC